MKPFRLLLVISLFLTACNIDSTDTPQAEAASIPRPSASTAGPSNPQSNSEADIIFHNGHVLTMNGSQPSVDAIAIRGEKILAVGSNDEILALRGAQTNVIDLGGLILMPGFVDAHSHLFGEDLLNNADDLPSQRLAIENGVTTITEMGMDEFLFEKLKSAADAGRLQIRVNAYLGYTTNCGDLMGGWWKAYRPNQQIAPNLYLRGIKIFTDGGSCKVPAVSVDYPGGGKGDLFFTQEQLNQIVIEVQAAGFQAAIHALGDRAVEQTQNAIAAALNGQPNTYRHRIEHNAVIRPEMLTRYSEIGIVPVIFGAYPTCTRTSGNNDFKYTLPAEYGRWEWPWRALVDANPGLPIAWHADYGPFHTINPFYILWGFVTRNEVNTDGSICVAPDWFKEGAIRVEEALPMMTINPAYALFMEDQVGSLEAGKFADVIIVSDNPLSVDSDSLKDIKALMTMIGGKVEYCAAGFDSLCPSASSPDLGAGSVSATASASLPDSSPTGVLDGNPESIWNSGAYAPQWIQIDLGRPTTVEAIRLTVSQYPEGETVHQIWAGADANNLGLVHEFKGFTSDPSVLEFTPAAPLTNIQFIKIITTQSPSWVAWREIEVVSP